MEDRENLIVYRRASDTERAYLTMKQGGVQYCTWVLQRPGSGSLTGTDRVLISLG
jgi:hypothetical protein